MEDANQTASRAAAGSPEGSRQADAASADGAAETAVTAIRNRAVEAALRALQEESLYWRAKQAVKEELVKPRHDATYVATAVADALRANGRGLDIELKRLAYEGLRQSFRQLKQQGKFSHPDLPTPPLTSQVSSSTNLDVVEWARSRWAYLTLARLRELSREQQQPFLRPRNQADEDDEVSTRHVVDIDSLYDLLTKDMQGRSSGEPARNGGSCAHGSATASDGCISASLRWSSLGVHLHTPSVEVLRERYRELAPSRPHLGVPDPPNSPGDAQAEFAERRLQEGQSLVARPYPPQLHRFARFGVPPSLRRQVWTKCLAPQSDERAGVAGQNAQAAMQEVARGVCTWEWLTDDALRLDVAEHCSNDMCYFPFDEIVEAMILALSRDAAIAEDCENGPPQIPIYAGPESALPAQGSVAAPSASADGAASCGGATGSAASQGQGYVPPCGIVPFRGFSCYACPFAFLADRLETAYPLFRAFYCRYLAGLHTISCAPGTLLPLCALFEALVFTKAPRVAFHLAELGEEAAPLRIAFPWLVRGFVGYLRIDQVLWLWDRILGFDTTEPIAMLAAAIFVFRSRLLLAARSAADVASLFSDLSELKAIPLLQYLLDPGSLGGSAAPAQAPLAGVNAGFNAGRQRTEQ